MFSPPDSAGHEALLFTKDAASGLRALMAIHDTTLGPAFGGCRMYPYASEQHALTDVLRLSRGMTYKAGDLRTALWRRQVGDDRRPAPRQDAGAASRDGSHHRGPRRPLHHRRRRGHNARGLDNHAGSDVPYCRSDGGRAASLARDRVRRVRGPARRCGGLPRPQRLGGAASRRPGAGQCRYAIVRLLACRFPPKPPAGLNRNRLSETPKFAVIISQGIQWVAALW